MLNLNLIILEVNDFVGLTEASIQKQLPGTSYTVQQLGPKGVLNTALNLAEGKLSLVVTSGVVFNLKDGDLPPLAVLKKYHLCAARSMVYSDHDKYKQFYSYVDKDVNPKQLDLNVFLINPAMWDSVPDKDAGALRDKKLLAMPRYMNHKTDELIETCVSPYEALKYGMLGEHAAILNYRKCLEEGRATVIERYAYCFDKFRPYVDLLNKPQRDICLSLADKTTIAPMRSKMADALGYRR